MRASLPADLQAELECFAAEWERNYSAAFAADPTLKQQCARMFKSLLPPRGLSGRPAIASVTKALRLLKIYRQKFAGVSAAQLWARIYDQVIPNYGELDRNRRIHEHQLLRDRVRSRKNMQRRRKKPSAVVSPETN